MEDKINSLQHEVDAVSKRVDSIMPEIKELSNSVLSMQIVLTGTHGANGLKGEVRSLKQGFGRYREAMRGEVSTVVRDMATGFEKVECMIRQSEHSRRVELRQAMYGLFAGLTALAAGLTLLLRITGLL